MSAPTVRQLKNRVQAGAELLDTKKPGWWRKIQDEAALDLSDPYKCTLGFLYAAEAADTERGLSGYEEGVKDLFGYDGGVGAQPKATDNGFLLTMREYEGDKDWDEAYDEYTRDYKKLRDLWLEEIRQRKGTAVGS